jgi:hypothetical protein
LEQKHVPDLQITTRETLHQHLHAAMQLEHATLPPYLTALYSIRPGSNPDAVQVLRAVAVEEMLHLALAANLLNAVGGKPNLLGSDFVVRYPAYLPDREHDFEVHLQSFSQDAVRTFLKIERPSMAPDPGSRLLRRDGNRPVLLGSCPLNPELRYYSTGEFYRAIEQGLVYLDDQARAEGKKLFAGHPNRQITSEHYYSGGGKLFCVNDIASASRAINLIIAQGEGEDRGVYGPEGELAHFYRFDQLLRGQYYQHRPSHEPDEPGSPTGPELKVDWSAVYSIKKDAKLAQYQSGSELHAAAVAFNASYAEFLRLLTRAFNGEPTLLLEAVPKMFDMRNQVIQVMRNPLGDGSALNAAPTFEISGTSEVRA